MNKFSSILALVLLPIFCLAQNSIKGKVIDLKTKQWLPGTSVVIDGTTTATMTDENGNFSLEIPAASGEQFSMTFSFTGYDNQTMAVKSHTRNRECRVIRKRERTQRCSRNGKSQTRVRAESADEHFDDRPRRASPQQRLRISRLRF